MRRLGLLSAVLCTGCLDWITVIPSDYIRLDAGPRPVVDGGGVDAGAGQDAAVGQDITAPIDAGSAGTDAGIDAGADDAGSTTADAGPPAGDSGPQAPYTPDRDCQGASYRDLMTVCMRFNNSDDNEAPNAEATVRYGSDSSGYTQVETGRVARAFGRLGIGGSLGLPHSNTHSVVL